MNNLFIHSHFTHFHIFQHSQMLSIGVNNVGSSNGSGPQSQSASSSAGGASPLLDELMRHQQQQLQAHIIQQQQQVGSFPI